MAMVGELTRRQQELIKIIQNKDKEIDDHKAQGSKVTRSEFSKSNNLIGTKNSFFEPVKVGSLCHTL